MTQLPVHVLYAIEVTSEEGARRLLEQSADRPVTFTSRDSAEHLITASGLSRAQAVELTLTARYPEP